MIFRNNLYIVNQCDKSDESALFHIELNANHTIYQAHFPGQPITPGVCLLQIARELLEDYCSHDLEIRHVKNIKFLSVVSPIEHSNICISLGHITDTPGSVQCRAQVESPSGEALAKLSFTCDKRD